MEGDAILLFDGEGLYHIEQINDRFLYDRDLRHKRVKFTFESSLTDFSPALHLI